MYDVINIFDMITRHFSNQIWLITFAVCIIYLFCVSEKWQKAVIITIVIAFFCFINDFVRILFRDKFGEGSVFYRHLWMIPIATVIGIAFIDCFVRFKKPIFRILLIGLGSFIVFWAAGDMPPIKYTLAVPANEYLVSDDEIFLGEEIERLQTERNKHLYILCQAEVKFGLELYTRAADFTLSFTMNDANADGDALLREKNPDIQYIMSQCCENGIDYIITLRSEDRERQYSDLGYSPEYTTDRFAMYACSGYPGKTYDQNKWRQVSWVQYHDDQGNPTKNELGYSKICYEYDRKGNMIQENYLDETDHPVNRTDTYYASRKVLYNNGGVSTGERYYDTEGEPVLCKKGYAGWDCTRGKGHWFLSMTYLGTDEEPIMLDKGYASFVRTLDDCGNILTERYLDTAGQLTECYDSYAEVVREYDEKEQLIKEIYLNTEGNPVNNRKGYAGFERVYEDGVLIEETRLDESDINPKKLR